MTLHMKIPGGGELFFELKPMDKDRFEALCLLFGALIAAESILRLFEIMA